MADTYRHAYITIAATGSKNSEEGCFRKASTGAIARPLRKTPGMVVRERRWPDAPLLELKDDPDFADYPLLHRAWVYQERRMSRRMVHFTNSQLVWECQRFIQGEDGATLNKEDSTAVCSGCNSTSVSPDWKITVEEYSNLQLSFEKDRLPAISAVVQAEMRTRKDDVYMAGMWRNSLLEDLLWFRTWTSEVFLHEAGPRPERMSPSWSWTSVKGQVKFPVTVLPPKQYVQLEGVQMTEISYIAKGLAHMGEYSEASITLRAPFTEATFPSSQSGSDPDMHDLRAKWDSSYPQIRACGTHADYDFLNIQDQDLDSQQYAFVFIRLQFSWGEGLVLRRRSDTEYERIGFCSCYVGDSGSDGDTSVEEQLLRSYLSSLPLREVKII